MSNVGDTDISGMIKGIMENPEFARVVRELRGDSGKSDTDVRSEMMDKLPEVMSMLGPMLGGQSKEGDRRADQSKYDEDGRDKRADRDKGDAHELKLLKNLEKCDKAKASRLMSALKPYLSPERCGMIDKCMSVLQLGDVMSVLQGLDGLNLNDK